MDQTRDKHVDVMLFWGIIFVVMGHSAGIPWFFFPSYAFHIPFFFFISGYLFKVKIGLKDKIRFIIKKTINQLIPYFVISLIFFAFTHFLTRYNINLALEFNLKNLFVTPFISGGETYFIIPMWFLLSLFIVNIIMQIIYFRDSKVLKWIITICVLFCVIFLFSKGIKHPEGIKLFILRTIFSILFFQLGMLVRIYKKLVDKLIINPITIIIFWMIVALLYSLFGNISYAIVNGSIDNQLFYIPIITTTLIIFISYAICYYISKEIKNNSLIILIGQNTFWIMAFHLVVFFGINIIFYKLGYISIANLATYFYIYKMDRLYLLYIIPGLLLPVFVGLLYKKIKVLFYKKLII